MQDMGKKGLRVRLNVERGLSGIEVGLRVMEERLRGIEWVMAGTVAV